MDSEPWPREALWVVKHRHPTNPAGYARYYCAEHKPTPKLAPPVSAPERARRAASSGPRKPAAASIPERAVVLCPDCFVQVPPTGVCGMCGQQVA